MESLKSRELADIKNRYANHLVLTIVIIGAVALLISLRETFIHGWRLDSFTDSLGYLVILGIYIFRKKISAEVKIGVLIASATATGAAGLLTNSVISMFAPYFILGAIFSVIFFDLKVTISIVSFQILFFALVFILKVKGIISYSSLDPEYRAYSNDNWLNYFATFVLFLSLIVVLSHSFYDQLKQTNRTLKDLNLQLQAEVAEKERAYQEIKESNEEVAAAEDELRATNDELVNVNEQLSKKNDELAKYHNYLEELVQERTSQIYDLNDKLSITNDELLKSNKELIQQKEELATLLGKLKATQAELVQSEKMASLGILTAGIAHEINNPINFINSGVYGLQTLTGAIKEYLNDCLHSRQNGMDLTAKEKELLEITQEMDNLIDSMLMGVDRTSAIIRSLKIFSYAGSGMKERIDIHEGLDATIIMLQHLIKNRIEVFKSYGRLPMVLCNSSQINQVFMNILTNAIDAIPDRGEISIKTLYDSEDNHVVIVVSDSGIGIPDALNKRIYEPFFTTKEAGKGTGLGLSISYNIVKEHNGELFFDSTPGSGTTFYIELPVE